MQRFFLSFASLRDELNRIHICKSLVEFHATRKQDYNIMVRSRKRCAYDVQRETIVIRLPGYCLPLYLVGNHFERYYASPPRHFVPEISPTDRKQYYRYYPPLRTYSPFLISIKYSEFPAIEIRSDRWSTITYKITKANERATNKKKKKTKGKKKRERESSQLQRSFWPKYSSNLNGTLVDTRGVKNSARRRRKTGSGDADGLRTVSRSHVVKLSVRLCLKISVVAF